MLILCAFANNAQKLNMMPNLSLLLMHMLQLNNSIWHVVISIVIYRHNMKQFYANTLNISGKQE
jgi:hypothetical protein